MQKVVTRTPGDSRIMDWRPIAFDTDNLTKLSHLYPGLAWTTIRKRATFWRSEIAEQQ